MEHHQLHENVYQETDFDEKLEHHVGGSKDEGGSSSESDFEYITEDSLLGHKSNLPTSRKTSADLNYTNLCGTHETERKVSSDDSMTIVDCDFKDVGCEARLPQRDMSDHLEQAVVYHLSIQAVAMKALRTANEELTAKYERLEMKHRHLESKVNELLNITEKLASTKDLERQAPEDDGVSKSLHQDEDSHYPPKSFTKSASHFLLPQAVPKVTPRSSSKRPMSANFPLSTVSYVDDGSYINDDEMPKPQTSIFMNDDNWQYSYIPVEPTSPLPLEIKQQSEKSTKLIVTNFERHRISKGSWISRPFYTHLQGYKMCLRITADGEGTGKGTHITVAVYLMKGEFDDQLEWPFRGDITIQLLNQQGDKKGHFTRTIRGAEAVRGSGKSGEKFISAWGISQFKLQSEVYQKFLKNDSLKFQVATVIKPPTTSPHTIKTEV